LGKIDSNFVLQKNFFKNNSRKLYLLRIGKFDDSVLALAMYVCRKLVLLNEAGKASPFSMCGRPAQQASHQRVGQPPTAASS